MKTFERTFYTSIPTDFANDLLLLPEDRVGNRLVQLLAENGGHYDRRTTSCFAIDSVIDAAEEDGTMSEAIQSGWISCYLDGEYGHKEPNRNIIYTLCPAVGMGATKRLYSDAHACEVIAVSKTGHKIAVRQLKAERDPSWKPDFTPGGFVGHTSNDRSLKYRYSSNPEGCVMHVFRNKLGIYKSGGCFICLGVANEYYDSNF
jgi:hypothetical protein